MPRSAAKQQERIDAVRAPISSGLENAGELAEVRARNTLPAPALWAPLLPPWRTHPIEAARASLGLVHET